LRTPEIKLMKLSDQKGVTLIEVVVVIVILGVLGVLGAPILMSATRIYVMEKSILSTDAQAQLAVERMVREIRRIQVSAANPTLFTVNRLSFTLDGAQVTYSLNAQSQLLRNSDILATGVSGLSFTYFRTDWTTPATAASQLWGIQIQLQFAIDQVGTQRLTTSVSLPYGASYR
jgi:prepilin-type N-terminal cleavage/methylation domain-containing protein